VIILGFIALVIFQNQTFFLAKNAFRLNFGFAKEFLSPEIPNAILFLIFFFLGLVISYLFSFSARFKAKRTIKKLNTGMVSQTKELKDLKSEIETLKSIEAPAGDQADTAILDTDLALKTVDMRSADPTAKSADTAKIDAAKETSNPTKTSADKPGEKKK
jgi:uncharacterized integral membrane protein